MPPTTSPQATFPSLNGQIDRVINVAVAEGAGAFARARGGSSSHCVCWLLLRRALRICAVKHRHLFEVRSFTLIWSVPDRPTTHTADTCLSAQHYHSAFSRGLAFALPPSTPTFRWPLEEMQDDDFKEQHTLGPLPRRYPVNTQFHRILGLGSNSPLGEFPPV